MKVAIILCLVGWTAAASFQLNANLNPFGNVIDGFKGIVDDLRHKSVDFLNQLEQRLSQVAADVPVQVHDFLQKGQDFERDLDEKLRAAIADGSKSTDAIEKQLADYLSKYLTQLEDKEQELEDRIKTAEPQAVAALQEALNEIKGKVDELKKRLEEGVKVEGELKVQTRSIGDRINDLKKDALKKEIQLLEALDKQIQAELQKKDISEEERKLLTEADQRIQTELQELRKRIPPVGVQVNARVARGIFSTVSDYFTGAKDTLINKLTDFLKIFEEYKKKAQEQLNKLDQLLDKEIKEVPGQLELLVEEGHLAITGLEQELEEAVKKGSKDADKIRKNLEQLLNQKIADLKKAEEALEKKIKTAEPEVAAKLQDALKKVQHEVEVLEDQLKHLPGANAEVTVQVGAQRQTRSIFGAIRGHINDIKKDVIQREIKFLEALDAHIQTELQKKDITDDERKQLTDADQHIKAKIEELRKQLPPQQETTDPDVDVSVNTRVARNIITDFFTGAHDKLSDFLGFIDQFKHKAEDLLNQLDVSLGKEIEAVPKQLDALIAAGKSKISELQKKIEDEVKKDEKKAKELEKQLEQLLNQKIADLKKAEEAIEKKIESAEPAIAAKLQEELKKVQQEVEELEKDLKNLPVVSANVEVNAKIEA